MRWRWVTDLEDPRTLLLVSVIVLIGGSVAVMSWISEGGFAKTWALVWIVVAVGQWVWAVLRFLKWRERQRTITGAAPDGDLKPK